MSPETHDETGTDAPRFTVEEVRHAPTPPRARVEDAERAAESAGDKLERKKDYLEGFLAQKPADASPGEPGGALYEAVVAALRDIFDPRLSRSGR